MSKEDRAMVSPAQAAQVAGVSRRTIVRAITSMELRAVRDNRGHWRIATDDLRAWAIAQSAPIAQQAPKPESDLSQRVETLREVVGQLGAALQAAERARDQAEADRDHWRDQAKALAARRRWWPF